MTEESSVSFDGQKHTTEKKFDKIEHALNYVHSEDFEKDTKKALNDVIMSNVAVSLMETEDRMMFAAISMLERDDLKFILCMRYFYQASYEKIHEATKIPIPRIVALEQYAVGKVKDALAKRVVKPVFLN